MALGLYALPAYLSALISLLPSSGDLAVASSLACPVVCLSSFIHGIDWCFLGSKGFSSICLEKPTLADLAISYLQFDLSIHSMAPPLLVFMSSTLQLDTLKSCPHPNSKH